MPSAADYLSQLLDQKEQELDATKREAQLLQQLLDKAIKGCDSETKVLVDDDPSLPLPRLELVYDSQEIEVHYRLVKAWSNGLVYAHPLGGYAHPLGHESVLANAAYDNAHLFLPVFKICPGQEPKQIHFGEENCERPYQEGRAAVRGHHYRDDILDHDETKKFLEAFFESSGSLPPGLVELFAKHKKRQEGGEPSNPKTPQKEH